MKCPKCGAEFSPKVLRIHSKQCKDETEPKQKVKKDPEIDIQKGLIMAELDERGIKYDKRKSKENLLIILEEAKKEAD